MATKIETLKRSNGDQVLPRTCAKAVSMENGTTVEAAIVDLNNHNQFADAHANMGWISSEDVVASDPIPLDADTLNGHNSSYFATKNDIADLNDVLYAGGQWEIINEVTTTEEVASLTIGTDLDGNTFDLAEMQVEINFPTYGTANATLWYLYFTSGTLNFTTSSFMNDCQRVFIDYNALSNRGTLMYCTYAGNTKVENMGLKAKNITEFRIANWNSCVLPVGTIIRIIGRRASK